MTIAPVRCTVEVRQPPAEAFALFTGQITRWWQPKALGAWPPRAIVIEPHVEGRWYEVDADGIEHAWGKVVAWEPPARLVLGWQLDATFRFDPAMLTKVELNFAALATGGTRVSLEHRDLERFGSDAARVAESIGGGWPSQLEGFARFSGAEPA